MKHTIGEFEEIVLLLVAAQHDQAYGLSVCNSIENDLRRKVTLSSVHTALYRLEEKGLVESKIGGATSERGGRRKRFFVITNLGKSALIQSRDARAQLWSMVPEFVLKIT